MITAFYTAKGGQGCSVTAAAFALQLAGKGQPVALIEASTGDLAAVLGLPEPSPTEYKVDVNPTLTLWLANDAFGLCYLSDVPALAAECVADGAHVVIDYGRVAPQGPLGPIDRIEGATMVLVIRACYIALRRAIGGQPDRVVLVEEPGRSLGKDDVASVLGAEVTVIPWDPSIGRAVDAGLLASRLPRAMSASAAMNSEVSA